MKLVTDEYRKVDESTSAHIRYSYDSNGRKTAAVEYTIRKKANPDHINTHMILLVDWFLKKEPMN